MNELRFKIVTLFAPALLLLGCTYTWNINITEIGGSPWAGLMIHGPELNVGKNNSTQLNYNDKGNHIYSKPIYSNLHKTN